MIQEKSMLIDLTIRKWSAQKHDKTVSNEVEVHHAAKNAGRYNKYLIDKAHLAEVETQAGLVRKFHYSQTLAWSERGQRLLPSALFFDYQSELAKLRGDFTTAVNDFIAKYPGLVQQARTRLNTLFNPGDYPDASALSKLFGVDVELLPVPNAADFRVDLLQDTQDDIRQQITQSIVKHQSQAVKDVWERLREVLTRVVDQCSKTGDDKPIIRDSLMGNINSLVKILDGLNITNDPAITQIGKDIEKSVLVPTLQLRSSEQVRLTVAAAAQGMLQRIP